jgi:hypothetical protein
MDWTKKIPAALAIEYARLGIALLDERGDGSAVAQEGRGPIVQRQAEILRQVRAECGASADVIDETLAAAVLERSKKLIKAS